MSDRVVQYWVRDDVTEAGKSDVELHHGTATTYDRHFGRNAGPGIAPQVTRDISRNYTTTVPSIATVQYITHVLSTIMTKSGAMSSLRLTHSHLRRGTK